MSDRPTSRLILAATLLLATFSFGCPDQITMPQGGTSNVASDPPANTGNDPVSVPEPATASLILVGGGLTWLMRKRQKQ